MDARRRIALSVRHIKAHTGVAGNEMVDVAADLGLQLGYSRTDLPRLLRAALERYRGPPATASAGDDASAGQSRRPLQLDSVLYWTRVLDRHELAVQGDETGAPPAQQAYELRLASANVLTLHPASEAGEGLSARRLHLEDCFDRLGFDIVGIQEGRRREKT